MKKITYSHHLQARLLLRKIPADLPRIIYKTSKERYFDTETLLYIAIQKHSYKTKRRDFALVYKEEDKRVMFITIHPLKLNQKISRVKSGRWKPL